ncbi:MAG TPA: xanthine dehydrogenase subunit D [Actinomycetota bacterium]
MSADVRTDTVRIRRSTGAQDGVGSNASRPDGVPKVTGAFEFASDMHRENMAWGATLRSPHPHASIRTIETSRAAACAGVLAVLTHRDVPGRKTYGMKIPDQPVLAMDRVRYQGEPVAVVAATSPELARRALAEIVVDYEVLDPVTDPEAALDPRTPLVHSRGNLVRHVRIRHGDAQVARRQAEVVVAGTYEIGMQDQAFLGPEAGLAIPASDGVELHVATQWLHEDLEQVAASLGVPAERVRIVLAGVGGAFGGREDLSIHIHACLLAMRTGRPVKMVYGREESFFGHVHRHPARMGFEHGATRDGRLVFVTARLLLDGGAYTSTSPVVIANASYFAAGSYRVPNVRIDGLAVYTNNPPCGAMRGFGAVQACYGVESNMDKLARTLGMDPVELRRRNALTTGTVLPTGQAVDGPAPARELLDAVAALPLPEHEPASSAWALPGGMGNASRGESLRRGIGYAIGMKAVGYSGGVDDSSTATVRLRVVGGAPRADVFSAAAECGQGIVTVMAQIACTELGIHDVVIHPADTSLPNAGSSSASRQTWMTGGAVKGACEAVRSRVLLLATRTTGRPADELLLRGGCVVDRSTGDVVMPLAELVETPGIEERFEFHHRPTGSIDPETGQGDAHVAFAFAAQRAIVDVDTELGLVRVVEIAVAEDVGMAINPRAVEGQIEGGVAQGLGLALLEEIRLVNGRVANPSFTDYLLPTVVDTPPIRIRLFETPHPDSPYGVNGVGELSALSSTPAIANAVRDATGRDLPRVPIHPDDIALTAVGAGAAGPAGERR